MTTNNPAIAAIGERGRECGCNDLFGGEGVVVARCVHFGDEIVALVFEGDYFIQRDCPMCQETHLLSQPPCGRECTTMYDSYAAALAAFNQASDQLRGGE